MGEERFNCRICGGKDEGYMMCHEIFGVMCQNCIKKHYQRLFNAAGIAITEEIYDIKQEENV